MLKRRGAMTMIGAAALLIMQPELVRHAWGQLGDVSVTLVKKCE